MVYRRHWIEKRNNTHTRKIEKKRFEEEMMEKRMAEYHGKKYYVVVWNVLRDFRMIKYVG